jgi:hypothetical protein
LAITEVLIDGVLCCFEMLPIAIVSCFVFNGSTLTWPISADRRPHGDPAHHHRDSIQPQSPATALEPHDTAMTTKRTADLAADDAEATELFVARNLGGTSLWYMGDLVHDLFNVWSWRYELPAARGIIA